MHQITFTTAKESSLQILADSAQLMSARMICKEVVGEQAAPREQMLFDQALQQLAAQGEVSQLEARGQHCYLITN